MDRYFKTRSFSRWLRKTQLTDSALLIAIEEMQQGLIDADLGGNVVKKRVALPGRGKRVGSRTLVATNKGDRWFFLFGFEKKERANITSRELEALREIASDLLRLSDLDLDDSVSRGILEEFKHDK